MFEKGLNPMIIVDISDNNSVTKHLNKRKANAYAKLNKLIACGFSYDLINAQIKGDLYKTYVRPVLIYGLNTYNNNIRENFF